MLSRPARRNDLCKKKRNVPFSAYNDVVAKKEKRDAAAAAPEGGKFAGVVTVDRPHGGRGEALASGTRVVVSLAEVRLGRLPEAGARSEIQLDVTARTTAQNGAALAAAWTSGVHYYVTHGARLNLADVVVFDGLVHQHLSLDLHIVERESPRMGPENAAVLAEAAAGAAATLAGGSGPLGTALGAFPQVVGGILRLGGDDQILRYGVSWFTREVARPPDRSSYLLEGTYRIEKRRAADAGEPAVTLIVDVCRVD